MAQTVTPPAFSLKFKLHGLTKDLTRDKLTSYFMRFGEIESAIPIPGTGDGMMTCRNVETVQKIIAAPQPHAIGAAKVTVTHSTLEAKPKV